MPEKLALSVQALQSGADIVYHDLVRAGPRRHFFSNKIILSREVESPVFQNLIEHGNALLNSSVVIRRKVLQKVGGLSEDPKLVGGEDLQFWLRIAIVTENFRRLPQALGYYWIGSANTFSPERAIACLTELRAHHFGNPHPDWSPAWVAFALAKANYVLGRYDEAMTELRKIRPTHQKLKYFIKANALKLIIFAQCRFGLNLKHYLR
jgi:hypothetical protein